MRDYLDDMLEQEEERHPVPNRKDRKALAKSIKFAHVKVGRGNATVAVGRLAGQSYVSMAFCSPRDNFCRATGRQVALRKLFNTGDYVVVPGSDNISKGMLCVQELLAYHQDHGDSDGPQWFLTMPREEVLRSLEFRSKKEYKGDTHGRDY